MHREVLLCVVLCGLCIASSHTAASRLVPAHDSHRLAKRQTATCPGVYFLEEPPSTLQCNPQPMGTLTVNCTFLNGIIDPGLTQTPIITIGWFFSSDGVIGNLVQSSAFQVRASLTAFRSVLVVSCIIYCLQTCIYTANLGAECSPRSLFLLGFDKWHHFSTGQQCTEGG